MEKKIRITMEEVYEDGTVKPVLNEDGKPRVYERKGAVVIAIDPIENGIKASCALLQVSLQQIASAIEGDAILKIAARRAVMEDGIRSLYEMLSGDIEKMEKTEDQQTEE